MNSNAKGKRGEREFAAFLRELGVEARRGQQYDGTEGRDVIADLPGYHFEVKRNEALRLREAVAQAATDAREDEVPVVVHRWNHGKWLAILPAEEFVRLARASGVEPPPECGAVASEEAAGPDDH